MGMWRKEIIEKKLKKAGLEDGAIRGHYKLTLRCNGRVEPSAFWSITIENLNDPSDSRYDHFTNYYPETIKAAIRTMLES